MLQEIPANGPGRRHILSRPHSSQHNGVLFRAGLGKHRSERNERDGDRPSAPISSGRKLRHRRRAQGRR